ncbi:MAG: YcnI family protein [Protaetiibacter sp.]
MKNSTRTTASVVAALGAGTMLALAPALAASAHVSASASSTAAGSYSIVTFSVPHGCDGSPTTAIEIEIPETILAVTPTVNPNWTVAKNMVTLDAAQQDAHGENITERVGSVTYTAQGAGLPDGYRDTMELSLQLPEGEAGDVVEFPVHQLCAEGSTDWVGDEVPSIVLTAAVAGDDHGHGDQGHGDAAADPDADTPTANASDPDVLARGLGIGGLAIGAVGLVLAIVARRDRATKES